MSLMSTSSYHKKALSFVILFNGGQVVVHSSLIYLEQVETFSQYWVSILFLSLNYLYDTDAILSISLGSAVAVEHIFSGGRDTISLRHASLKPETIRTLMLVKQRLRLARTAIWDILGD
jgi:hypothetical protein